MLKYIIFTLIFAFSFSNAQMRHVSFYSNIKTQNCKKKVENNLDRANGVLEYTADEKSKIVTVKFNPTETNPENIKKLIIEAGYNAEEMKAKPGKKQDCKEKNENPKKQDNAETPESCCGR